MKINCVIFDCDGLMFDTERIAQEAWTKIAAQYHIQLDEDFFIKITGSGKQQAQVAIDQIDGLKELLPQIRKARFEAIYRAAQEEDISKKGLHELCAYLKQQGIQMAVASSSFKDYVTLLLQSVHLEQMFTTVVCGDEVERLKPYPDLFLKAAEKTGVAPEHCFVLEDSKMGLMASAMAKMRCGYIEDTIRKDKEIESLMNIEFDSLFEVIDFIAQENGVESR